MSLHDFFMHLGELEDEYDVDLHDKIPFFHNIGKDISRYSYFDEKEKEE